MQNLFIERAREGKNSWWRYLLTLGIVIALVFIATLVLLIFAVLIEGHVDIFRYPAWLQFLISMLSFPPALMGLWLGIRYIHRRSFLSLITPYRRPAWSRFFLAGAVWLSLMVVSDLFLAALQPGNYVWTFEWRQFLLFLLFSLALIPIQTSTEELVFRGYLTQGFGLLTRNFWIAWLVPSLIFGLLHSANPEVAEYGFWWTMPSYIGYGLLLGWVTLKTEGLEIALGMHAVNNLYASLVVTFPSSAITSPALFTIQTYNAQITTVMFLLQSTLFLLIMSWLRRRGLWGSRTEETPLVSMQQPAQAEAGRLQPDATSQNHPF